MSELNVETFSPVYPKHIKWQELFINDFFSRVRHRKGVQQILLSGAVGSSKSKAVQYIFSRLLLEKKSQLILTRRALPDLRDSCFNELKEMLTEKYIESEDNSQCKLKLINGSSVLSKTFADQKTSKVRSLSPDYWYFEELTELEEHMFTEPYSRLGRNGDDFSCLIGATNPEGPDHWVHKRLIENAGWINGVKTRKREGRDLNIHVYYSLTVDNLYLNEEYIKNLKKNLSPKEAERKLEGKWVNIAGEGIYHAYDEDKNFITDKKYIVDIRYPIRLCFDFNTAEGKPMSACAMQYIDDKVHIFREFIIYKTNTHGLMQEIVQDEKENGKGILDYNCQYIIHADATGRTKHSSATTSDISIIKQYIDHYSKKKVDYEVQVPSANPPVKDRINLVNSYCYNLLNEIRLFVYNCVVVNNGFKNSQWKKGANGVEDDSYYAQHVTTAAGYGIWRATRKGASIEQLE